MTPPTEPLPEITGVDIPSLAENGAHPVLAGIARLMQGRIGVPVYTDYEDGPYRL